MVMTLLISNYRRYLYLWRVFLFFHQSIKIVEKKKIRGRESEGGERENKWER